MLSTGPTWKSIPDALFSISFKLSLYALSSTMTEGIESESIENTAFSRYTFGRYKIHIRNDC